ncbi:MAG: hypothetical protein GX089_08530 [Fibrobacter sp.]|nr:hypothetical protein [Fibrobacter sp.]HON09813.1 hypothetical protein [Chitinispirillaceae bacterium]
MNRINIFMLLVTCLFFGCDDSGTTGPVKNKIKTSGTFSYTLDGNSFTVNVPEGAGQCIILGDSTMWNISVSGSDSKENSEAKISMIVFFGFTKSNKTVSIARGFSDSTVQFGFYDNQRNAYNSPSGTITFTNFPKKTGDPLSGTINATLTNVNNMKEKQFSAEFSLICESIND